MSKEAKPEGLALLRVPFPPHHISKLPKPTKKQTEDVRADFKKGIRCKICGAWHHPDVVHLDYVGHAALTDRLLDCDPKWTWEPCVKPGLPDPGNGMWIELTVCGVSRIGYGSADGKSGGDAIKEIIGDGLRNAAMRFGAALDLWHKGDLHLDASEESAPETREGQSQEDAVDPPVPLTDADWSKLAQLMEATSTKAPVMLKALSIDVPTLDDLNPAQYATVIDGLERKLAKMAKDQTNKKASSNG